MSLVEQAIARLRQQQGTANVGTDANRGNDAHRGADMDRNDASRGSAERSSRSSSRIPVVEPLEDPASLAHNLPVDTNALRAAGYLPEKDKDRQFADHYRRIKRPLIDKALGGDTGGGEPRILMVASAVPGDGKTFTSINLALSMALERDISVLLIDADVAKQHVTDIFGLRGKLGLLDALGDESVDPESLIIPTNMRGLSILPAGQRVENTVELLSSTRMRKIAMGMCARNPRRILLLDSPPLLITNEGRVLLKIAGQVVLVVRAGETPRHAVKAAVDMFDANQAGGMVLNQVKVGLTEGYYGYGAYGYGADDHAN